MNSSGYASGTRTKVGEKDLATEGLKDHTEEMAVAISNINEGSMSPIVTETFREKRYDKSMDEEMNIVTNEHQ